MSTCLQGCVDVYVCCACLHAGSCARMASTNIHKGSKRSGILLERDNPNRDVPSGINTKQKNLGAEGQGEMEPLQKIR